MITPLISLVLGGKVSKLDHEPIWFSIQHTKGSAAGCQKMGTTFLALSQMVKAYLLLRYCTKNQFIDVA